MAATKFITIDILKSHDQWLYDYISKEDAKAIKAVSIKGNELLFYKEEKPGEDATPAYRIELPSQDVSTLIQKVANATADNLPSLTADGAIKDTASTVVEEGNNKSPFLLKVIPSDLLV